jgi:hypothetical protein
MDAKPAAKLINAMSVRTDTTRLTRFVKFVIPDVHSVKTAQTRNAQSVATTTTSSQIRPHVKLTAQLSQQRTMRLISAMKLVMEVPVSHSPERLLS